jgi:hypothetical protein
LLQVGQIPSPLQTSFLRAQRTTDVSPACKAVPDEEAIRAAASNAADARLAAGIRLAHGMTP